MSPAPRVSVLLLVALTLLVFGKARHGEFLAWDDDINITQNPHLRELTRENLAWMFTDTAHMRRFVPLTWLGWAVERHLVGLTPLSAHVGNIVLHAANAVLVWLILRAVFRVVGRRRGWADAVVEWGAMAGAALWAWHPLRVEVVAWASGRIYCQALFFLLLALAAYLRAAGEGRPWWRNGWYWASTVAFAASVFTYPIGLAFVGLLLVADFLVLQREAPRRRLLAEKVPFAAVTLAVGVLTVWARMRATGIWSPPIGFAEFGLVERAMQAFYVWAYYVWKPLVPVGLAPAYTTLMEVDPAAPRFVLGALLVLTVTVVLGRRWRRWPEAWGLWLMHLLVLVPVLGLTEHPHYTSDRYSYLQGILWAGAAGSLAMAGAVRRTSVAMAATGMLAAAMLLTWRQIPVWRDSTTLFGHLYEQVGPTVYRADIALRLADQHLNAGRVAEAERWYREALTWNPTYARRHLAWWGLGRVTLATGRAPEAVDLFRASVESQGDFMPARVGLAFALREAGRAEEGLAVLEEVLRLAPQHEGARRLRETWRR